MFHVLRGLPLMAIACIGLLLDLSSSSTIGASAVSVCCLNFVELRPARQAVVRKKWNERRAIDTSVALLHRPGVGERSVKKFHHPKKQDFDLCAVLEALSDPLRLAFVRKMWAEGECSCSSFEGHQAKSTRSHHFKVLREAGLITTTVRGTEFGLSLRKGDLDDRFPGLMDAVLTEGGSKKRTSSRG